MKKYITLILFIIFILIIIIYNISLANDVKVYFENERNGSKEDEILNEDEYCVDIYAETTEKVIGGFQFQLLYPDNIELIDVVSWEVGKVDMNPYNGKVIGYKDENSQSTAGKVRLCTLIFKVLEESENGSYDVRIDFNNNYSKVKDIKGDTIDLESDKENGSTSGGNTGNATDGSTSGGNTGNGTNGSTSGGNAGNGTNGNTSEEDISGIENGNSINKNIQKNDSINLIEGSGIYRDENGENSIPKTGEGSNVIIINMMLITITIVLGIILIRYKVKGI